MWFLDIKYFWRKYYFLAATWKIQEIKIIMIYSFYLDLSLKLDTWCHHPMSHSGSRRVWYFYSTMVFNQKFKTRSGIWACETLSYSQYVFISKLMKHTILDGKEHNSTFPFQVVCMLSLIITGIEPRKTRLIIHTVWNGAIQLLIIRFKMVYLVSLFIKEENIYFGVI